MPKKKPTKSPDKQLEAPKKKRGRKKKYISEMALVAENVLLRTGQMDAVYRELGVGKGTLYRWIEEKPELREALARARESRQRFGIKEFLPELEQAFKGLNALLLGQTVTLKKKETNSIYDRESGELQKHVNVKETESEQYYRPDMRAIEKVIGPNNIRNNIYIRALEDHVLNNDSELYKLVFGDLSMDEEADQFKGIFVLRVQLDQLKIRYMEAHIQRQYDRGNISIDQWVDFTEKLRRNYAVISDKMETRAQKMLGGYSYQEIVLQVEQTWKSIVEVFEECIADTYERKDAKRPYVIPKDVQDMLMEKAIKMIKSRSDGTLLAVQNAPLP